MKDPYVLENGTLKNLLGISNYEELNKAERDIGFVKLLNTESIAGSECNIELLRNIHRHIFEDIFEWAGEFRTVPLYKEEVVIPGVSLTYAKPNEIEKKLEAKLKEMNSYEWKGKNINEITKKFTSYLTQIWRVHPFRDGNTRTTLTFANIFSRQNGFEIDMSTMLNNLGRIEDPKTNKIKQISIRDKFVLASLDKENCPEPEYLESIIKKAIEKGKNKQIDLTCTER